MILRPNTCRFSLLWLQQKPATARVELVMTPMRGSWGTCNKVLTKLNVYLAYLINHTWVLISIPVNIHIIYDLISSLGPTYTSAFICLTAFFLSVYLYLFLFFIFVWWLTLSSRIFFTDSCQGSNLPDPGVPKAHCIHLEKTVARAGFELTAMGSKGS